MIYRVIENFKIKTAQAEMELQSGQVLTLPNDKAIILISDGKVTPLDERVSRLYSESLHAYYWVVQDDKDMDCLREQGIKEAIYTKQEMEKLKGSDNDTLRIIHQVKEVFENSKIEEIRRQ